MKITFVQNDKEKAESDRVIRAGLSLKKAKVGTWILPPNLSVNNKFVVVDSEPAGKDVFVESFDTIDGALMYALGIRSDGNKGKIWSEERRSERELPYASEPKPRRKRHGSKRVD